MFHKVFLEKQLEENPKAKEILKKIKKKPILIEKVENHWGKVKKPYLQKRSSLNLYIGEKRGQLLKLAPEAYGTKEGVHYYFIHAYNCLYECQYCYLQGYFQTPDMVMFINHHDIINEIDRIYQKHQKETPGLSVWFHAGEFSDSLALSHLTNEWPIYWEYFLKNPHAYLELRTKSVNFKTIINLPVAKNIITTVSLSPEKSAKDFDLKTPSLKARFNALNKLTAKGHYFGIHLDPIIYHQDFEQEYQELAKMISSLPLNQLHYISIGVVRFTKDVYHQVKQNYPHSPLHGEHFIKSFDNKVRYSKPMRMWILNTVKKALIGQGIKEKTIYLCME